MGVIPIQITTVLLLGPVHVFSLTDVKRLFGRQTERGTMDDSQLLPYPPDLRHIVVGLSLPPARTLLTAWFNKFKA